ncbi:terpene synthase family protein [Streptomyces sp. URMC 127]|uniref:terpene synthase family protein n=1 Tax=Streptomyces sp. URMC 127 TaxID=3423402 RepID=UPI003F199FE5
MEKQAFTLADLDGAQLPALRPPCPVRKNPFHESVREEFHHWLFSHGLFTPEQARRLKEYDLPLGASLMWPAGDRRSCWAVAAVTVIVSLRDDEIDSSYQANLPALEDWLAEAQNEFHTALDSRWGPIFSHVWRRLAEHLSASHMQRLSDAMIDYLQGCLGMAGRLAVERGFDDVQDYIRLRTRCLGMRMAWLFVEISRGVDIGDVRDHDLLQDLVRADSERHVAAQDILTLRKELAHGNYEENLVVITAKMEKCPLVDAVGSVHRIYQQACARYTGLAAEIANSELGKHAEVREFISGVDEMAAGVLAYYNSSPRYTSS